MSSKVDTEIKSSLSQALVAAAGGFSGGNIDRPGLKQFLVDVATGKADAIVL